MHFRSFLISFQNYHSRRRALFRFCCGIFCLLLAACSDPVEDKEDKNQTMVNPGGAENSSCDPVVFNPQNKAVRSASVDSETVSLSHCTAAVVVSVSGDGLPRLFKNELPVASGTKFGNGDRLRVQLTASDLEKGNHRAIVKVGNNASVFSVTTGDFTPAGFLFQAAINQAPSSWVTSEQVTLTDFDGTLTATVSGDDSALILVNGRVIGSAAQVQAGNAVAIRLKAAPSENSSRQAVLKVNGVSASFDVTTRGPVTTPVVTSVSVPPSGAYKQSANLDFIVNFSEPVKISGVPRLALNIGGAIRFANLRAGSATTSLSFRHVVESGTSDEDGIGLAELQLNDGSIESLNGVPADLGFVPPDSSLVIVDTSSPSIQLITGPPERIYSIGEVLEFSITLSEVVYVSGLPGLTLAIGALSRSVNYVSGSGTNVLKFQYQLQSGDYGGLNLVGGVALNGGSINDRASNPTAVNFTSPNLSKVKVALECPTNFVPVDQLSPYTSSDFCVAKYEMKCMGSSCPSSVSSSNAVAVSQASGPPWVNINRDESAKACQNLGAGYDLISNAQWQTIARNLEGVSFNWSANLLGHTGGLSRGHSDGFPASALAASTADSDACLGTGQSCSLSNWSDQRRVSKLSNGLYLWDFAGNVWEWVLDNNSTKFGADTYLSLMTSANHPDLGTIGRLEGNANLHFGPAGSYSSATANPYAGLGFAWLNYNAGAIRRGGYWVGGANVGVFSVGLTLRPLDLGAGIGFRCVWSP